MKGKEGREGTRKKAERDERRRIRRRREEERRAWKATHTLVDGCVGVPCSGLMLISGPILITGFGNNGDGCTRVTALCTAPARPPCCCCCCYCLETHREIKHREKRKKKQQRYVTRSRKMISERAAMLLTHPVLKIKINK